MATHKNQDVMEMVAQSAAAIALACGRTGREGEGFAEDLQEIVSATEEMLRVLGEISEADAGDVDRLVPYCTHTTDDTVCKDCVGRAIRESIDGPVDIGGGRIRSTPSWPADECPGCGKPGWSPATQPPTPPTPIGG